MLENTFQLDNYNYIFINESDYDKLKKIIKENIVSLCWGKENVECFNLGSVIKEFMNRFSSKSPEQKYGYIGEFIYYIYILQNMKVLRPLSLFFNQEEKSFKKGFDLLGFDGENIWYSEVKSGNSNTKDINEYNLERLNAAYRDINEKLQFKNRNANYWDTAKSNLCKIEGIKSERARLSKILDGDRELKTIENKIITSVVFNNSELQLDEKIIKEKFNRLKKNDAKITIVCIRKKTIDKIIDILKEVQEENE